MAAFLAFAMVLVTGSLQDFPEAGAKLDLPSTAELTRTGPAPDSPASIQQRIWTSRAPEGMVRFTYEKWRRPHFSAEEHLESFARRSLENGWSVRAIVMAGHDGSRLDSKDGRRSWLRVKSGTEAWEIAFELPAPNEELIKRVADSLVLATAPEPKGAYDRWGNPTSPVALPNPPPSVAEFKIVSLKAARVKLESPVTLVERKGSRQGEDSKGIAEISEWYGRAQSVELFLSHFRLAAGQTLDLSGWVAAYGDRLEADGLSKFEPDIQKVTLGAAQGRIITGNGQFRGRAISLQILLLQRGQDCWAIQTRGPANADGQAVHDRVRRTIQLLD